MKKILYALLIGFVSLSMIAAGSPVYPVSVSPTGHTVTLPDAGALPIGGTNAYQLGAGDGLVLVFSAQCKNLHIITGDGAASVRVDFGLKKPINGTVYASLVANADNLVSFPLFQRATITVISGQIIIEFAYCEARW